MNIHHTAIIHPEAQIAPTAEIGPYSIVGQFVKIGNDTKIGAHCIVDGHCTIGEQNLIAHHVVLGTPPQDLKYHGEPTELEIGSRNVIREYVMMNIGTATGTRLTRVGNDNLFMAYSHVAHDGRIGNHVILANAVTLAGHVSIDDHATIGGLSAFHQFTRMGRYAFVGGCSAISQDIPPFCLVAGNHAKLRGINAVGLRRHGFTDETINLIKRAVRTILNPQFNTTQALELIEAEAGNVPEIKALIDFVRISKRGICKA